MSAAAYKHKQPFLRTYSGNGQRMIKLVTLMIGVHGSVCCTIAHEGTAIRGQGDCGTTIVFPHTALLRLLLSPKTQIPSKRTYVTLKMPDCCRNLLFLLCGGNILPRWWVIFRTPLVLPPPPFVLPWGLGVGGGSVTWSTRKFCCESLLRGTKL